MIEAVLDTNILIDLLKRFPSATEWAAQNQEHHFAITPIIWMELVQGALNKQELTLILDFLNQFSIEHPTPQDNEWAMLQLARFRLSHNVQFPDVMIASVAVRLQVPLYTRNLKHFLPLPDLICQSPYR